MPNRTPNTGPGPPFAALTCGPRLTFKWMRSDIEIAQGFDLGGGAIA